MKIEGTVTLDVNDFIRMNKIIDDHNKIFKIKEVSGTGYVVFYDEVVAKELFGSSFFPQYNIYIKETV